MFYLNQKIKTTEKFVYPEITGEIIEIMPADQIVGIQFDKLPVKTEDETKIKLHSCNKMGKRDSCYYVKMNQIEPLYEYKYDNHIEQEFVNYMVSIKKRYKEEIQSTIKVKEINREDYINDINSYKKRIEQLEEAIKKSEKQIKELEVIKEAPIKIDELENYYKSLNKHPLIEKVMFSNSFLVIKTKNLTYKSVSPWDLGAYFIFINLRTKEVKAINYKKQLFKGRFFHPCIRENGSICLGQTSMELSQYLAEGNIKAAIFLLISFLEKPDYRQPYVDAATFFHAQKVSIRPKNIEEYLNPQYWTEKEKWNETEYQKLINN